MLGAPATGWDLEHQRCQGACKVGADEADPAGDDVAHEEAMAVERFRAFYMLEVLEPLPIGALTSGGRCPLLGVGCGLGPIIVTNHRSMELSWRKYADSLTPAGPQPTAAPLFLPKIPSSDPEYGKDQEILPGRRERVPATG